MKGKVLAVSLITTAVIMVIAFKGYLDPKKIIEINAYLVKFDCGESNIDLRVTAVSDSSVNFLIGRTISPELTFAQSKVNKAIDQLVLDNRKKVEEEFVLVGYVRRSSNPHCSGSACFQVKKIKLKSANAFVEF